MHDIDRLIRASQGPAGESSDFDLNPGITALPGTDWRLAGVLVPVWIRPGGARLLLTKRSSHLKHHPGQIAFPGGKVDAGDASPQAAALREAMEEIALPPHLVQVVAPLSPHHTVTGFRMMPYLGLVRDDFDPIPEAGEVDEVFSVPLSHVLTLANYRVEQRQWMGQWRRYHAVPYGPYYIWGATAMILRRLAERVAL